MAALTKSDFEARSEFRYRLTCFLRHGEQLAEAAGITFPLYLLMVHVKGTKGRSWALVGELAERMQLRHHSAVELVTRCEDAGFVERRRSDVDRRQVQVRLTRSGERLVQRIASAQSEQFSSLARGMRLDQKTGLPEPDDSAADACGESAASAKPRKTSSRVARRVRQA